MDFKIAITSNEAPHSQFVSETPKIWSLHEPDFFVFSSILFQSE